MAAPHLLSEAECLAIVLEAWRNPAVPQLVAFKHIYALETVDEGLPRVFRADRAEDFNTTLYFRADSQTLPAGPFLAMQVDEQERKVLWAGVLPVAKVYLVVYSEAHDVETLLGSLPLEPKNIRRRGEYRDTLFNQPMVNEENSFAFDFDDLGYDVPASLEEKLEMFFERLQPHADNLATLGDMAEATLRVVQHGFLDQYAGFALDREWVVRAAEWNLSLDVDFYPTYAPAEAADVEVAEEA